MDFYTMTLPFRETHETQNRHDPACSGIHVLLGVSE